MTVASLSQVKCKPDPAYAEVLKYPSTAEIKIILPTGYPDEDAFLN